MTNLNSVYCCNGLLLSIPKPSIHSSHAGSIEGVRTRSERHSPGTAFGPWDIAQASLTALLSSTIISIHLFPDITSQSQKALL